MLYPPATHRTALHRAVRHAAVLHAAVLAVCLAVVPWAWAARSAGAAENQPWEVAPYRVLVWIESPNAPSGLANHGADPLFFERLGQKLAAVRQATSGAVWATTIEPAPVPLTRWLSGPEDTPDLAPAFEQHGISADEWDRVVFVSLTGDRGWRITVREFDTLTRSWGNTHTAHAPQTELLLSSLLRLIYAQFAPLAQIERVEDAQVDLAPRAASLVKEERAVRLRRWNDALSFADPVDAPVWSEEPLLATSSNEFPEAIPGHVTSADAFLPILRRNDRTGKLAENGILRMPWTFLSQLQQDELGLHATLWSGYGQPLPGRRNIRTQRLALAIRSSADITQLRLVSKDSPDQPLAGYEVYAKGTSDRVETELLGTTDVEGYIEIGPTEQAAVRLLYVRSGGNLLARLPLVPGFPPKLTATITDDAPRLAAEGFVEGWRDQLVDTMARRQILARRVQRKIDEGNLEEAERWLRELKSGRTVGELAFELRAAKGEFLTGRTLGPNMKRRIDELFEKGQKLIAQDRSLAVEAELTSALEAAR